MKKYKFLSLILAILLLSSNFISTAAYAVNQPSITSNEAVVLDMTTGNAIYSKNADSKAYPASLTKVMTVLLAIEALENGKVSLSDSVTAAKDIESDLSSDGSTSGIKPGETMSFEDLLYCAMLSSANEACNIIADYIGGDKKTFVGMMNAKAQELGCTGTHFNNAHGLPDKNHYTTASDFAKISLEAMKHPLFAQICNTVSKTIPATNLSGPRNITNTNGLINNNSDMYPGYFYQYAAGVKTGHTEEAGYCLVSTADKDGTSLMCVVMGGKSVMQSNGKPKFSNFTDSVALYEWAFQNYSYREIIKTTDLVKDIPVKLGKNADYVTVHPETAIKALLPNDEDNSSFEQNVTIYSEQKGESLVAPITAGQELGEITVSKDGVVRGTSKLVACSAVDISYMQSIKAKLVDTLKKPAAIIFLLLVLAFFGVYYYLVARYKRSKKDYEKKHGVRRAKINEDSSAESKEAEKNKQRNVPRHSTDVAARKKEDNAKHSESDFDYSSELKDFYTDYNLESTDDKNDQSTSKTEKDYYEELFGKDNPRK